MARSAPTASFIGAMVVAIAVSGCSAAPAAPEPLTLRIGTDDHPGVPSADEISEFARQVSELSAGSITITPEWHVAGDTEDWDQKVAQMAVDGEIEMALIPSRAFDRLGVTTLQPLSTPFLIQSDQAVEAVIVDDLAADLMAGLDRVGLTGLGMFPEGLRHPFGYDGALLQPSDYDGGLVRVATSAVSEELYAAYGASVTDAEPDSTTQIGTDSSFLLNPSGTATGNVTFYPKVNVLVMNSEVEASLSQAQRTILDEAMIATRNWAFDNLPDEGESAAQFCAGGGSIEAASDAQIAELQDAAAGVVGSITASSGNAEAVDAIASLVAEIKSSPVIECAPGATPPEGEEESAINGTYRYEITPQDFAGAGITDDGVITGSSGVYSWTFTDGAWVLKMTEIAGEPDFLDHGTYDIEGARLTFRWTNGDSVEVTWVSDADGTLHLSPGASTLREDEVVLTSQDWVPVSR